MNITWPPPQVIFVGFESNQQGQAASQEQASSSCPETFQGSFFSSPARAAAAPASRTRTARSDFARIASLLFLSDEHTAAVSILLRDAAEVTSNGGEIQRGCRSESGREPGPVGGRAGIASGRDGNRGGSGGGDGRRRRRSCRGPGRRGRGRSDRSRRGRRGGARRGRGPRSDRRRRLL